MNHHPTRYRAFVLTLWEERSRDGGSPPVWRFRLETPRSGWSCFFTTLEEVMLIIETELQNNAK